MAPRSTSSASCTTPPGRSGAPTWRRCSDTSRGTSSPPCSTSRVDDATDDVPAPAAPRRFPSMKRTLAAAMTVALVVLGSFTVVGPTSAAVTALTGTITMAQPVALSGDAVAVVTLVDQTTGPDAGGVIGEQRIDGVASVPVAFEVPHDDSGIDSKHSYAIVASIVDGAKEYNSQEPVPVITGGPSVNVEAPVVEAPALPTAITGAIAVPAG